MRSWRRVIVAVLALTAFSASAWADCFSDSSEPQQMACCSGGHESCPMHDSTTGCCPTVSAGQPQATVVKAATAVAPALHVIAAIVAHVPTPAAAVRDTAHDASPPGAIFQPPAYIAFSGLLI
jgi:hypothetical protein